MRRPGPFPLVFGLCLLTLGVAFLVSAVLPGRVWPPLAQAITVEQVVTELKTGEPERLRPAGLERAPRFDPDDGQGARRLAALIADGLGLPEDHVVVDLKGLPRGQLILGEDGPQGNPRLLPTLVGDFSLAVRGGDGRWQLWEPQGEGVFDVFGQRHLLCFLLGALLMLPFAWWLSHRLAAPFATFADAAERLGRDPAAEIGEVRGPAEVQRAHRALRDMARRLHAFVTDRMQVVGALAHDLRTPLTRLAFRVEALPADQREAIRADIREMEAMVAATLAWVRGMAARQERERLELGSLVEQVADELSEMGHPIEVRCGDAAVVEGDPVALRRVFTNLLENAVAYGLAASAHVRVEAEEVLVEIDDEGPGLPEAELERVFEAFYRAEPSRNRDTGGIGLGLAYARSVARAHGGDIRLENRSPRGLRARVSLPLARGPARNRTVPEPSLSLG